MATTTTTIIIIVIATTSYRTELPIAATDATTHTTTTITVVRGRGGRENTHNIHPTYLHRFGVDNFQLNILISIVLVLDHIPHVDLRCRQRMVTV